MANVYMQIYESMRALDGRDESLFESTRDHSSLPPCLFNPYDVYPRSQGRGTCIHIVGSS